MPPPPPTAAAAATSKTRPIPSAINGSSLNNSGTMNISGVASKKPVVRSNTSITSSSAAKTATSTTTTTTDEPANNVEQRAAAVQHEVATENELIAALQSKLSSQYLLAYQLHDSVLACLNDHSDQIQRDKRAREQLQDERRAKIQKADQRRLELHKRLRVEESQEREAWSRVDAANAEWTTLKHHLDDIDNQNVQRRETIQHLQAQCKECAEEIETIRRHIAAIQEKKRAQMENLEVLREEVSQRQQQEHAAVRELERRQKVVKDLAMKNESLKKLRGGGGAHTRPALTSSK